MRVIFFLLFFCSGLINSQLTKRDKMYRLTESQYNDLKAFLTSKKITIPDTIIIKYDYNREHCWDNLDEKEDDYIKKVLTNFQNHIIDFNKKHPGAIAVNFREPDTRINKLKLWDKTIIIDDELFLKNLIFTKKRMCGNSAIIMNDGSYIVRFGDPHFNLLESIKK